MCAFNFNNSYVMIQGGDKNQSALLMLAVQAPTTTNFQHIFVVIQLSRRRREARTPILSFAPSSSSSHNLISAHA